MSRSKKNWNELVDRYGNYDFTSIFRQVDGVSQESLDDQLTGYVSRNGDVMSGGLFVQNDLGYAYAIEPYGGSGNVRRPAGTTEFTRNGRVIAEQYWDIAEQHLNFNIRDIHGAPQEEDSLEIGRDKIIINAETDIYGDLYLKGKSVEESLEELAAEINYQVGLFETALTAKYNKIGGDITGTMSVTVSGDTKLTVNRLGVTLGQAPTQNFHAATKKYVDDAIESIDFTSALTFLGVRDLTTVDPDGDEEFGNIYAVELDGTPTAAWGLSADVTEGTLVGLGENGWIVIGQVGLPDLSGYITIVDSDAKDEALSDRLNLLEVDPTTQGQLDTVNQNLSLRLEALEQDPITKTESDAGDKELSDRIDAIEGDYVVNANYIQDQSDLADALALKASIEYVDDQLTLKVDKTYVDTNFLALTGGTLTGNLDLSDNTITGVADPVEASDAVNKAYVEGGLAEYLKQGGDTVNTGSEVVYDFQDGIKFGGSGDFKTDVENVEIKSVETVIESTLKVTVAADVVSLQSANYINVNSKNIINVKDPTNNGDAANKGYVDGKFDSIGDVLVFKGTLDFTTDEAPAGPATGHVYSNSGTGLALASWGVGTVSPGQLYGFGETQWGIIGAGEIDLTGYATEEFVTNAIANIDIPDTDLTGYATEAYVQGYSLPLDISTLPALG